MKVDQLNWRHLWALPYVVRTGSVSAAARAVNMTQPAVTQGIAKLEAQLGLALFNRVRGVMVPTAAAHMLADRAENAIRLLGTKRATSAQIRAFVALASHGSYAAAAQATGLAEPSLHRAIGDLSLTIGARLVERQGRGVALTVRGLSLARQFRLALAELRSAVAEIAAMEGREVGQIVVGAMPLPRARLLPNALAQFQQEHGEVAFSVAEGSYAELIGPLRDGEIDMMLGALRVSMPGDDVVQFPLFDDRPIILARAGHPLAGQDRVLSAHDLIAFPWIVPVEGTPLRTLWARMFEDSGGSLPRVPIECGSVITIRQLLIQGNYLTLLSADQVAVELEAGWLIKVGPAPGDVKRTIGVTVRADWRPTPMQAAFVSALEKEAGRVAQPS